MTVTVSYPEYPVPHFTIHIHPDMARYGLAVVLAHYLRHWYYTSIEMKTWSEMEHELKIFLPVNPRI